MHEQLRIVHRHGGHQHLGFMIENHDGQAIGGAEFARQKAGGFTGLAEGVPSMEPERSITRARLRGGLLVVVVGVGGGTTDHDPGCWQHRRQRQGVGGGNAGLVLALALHSWLVLSMWSLRD